MRHQPPLLSHHVIAVTCFLALALWIVSPVLGDFQGSVLGHTRNDAWNHLWGYWYVADALLDGHLPTHTDLLVWPTGGSLWFIDAFNALLTLPIQLLFGVVAAYNAACLFNFLLCGVGAYALSLRVTGSWWGALAAGLAYESTPQLLGQAYNGISETLSAGWLPLSLLAIRQAVRSGRRRDAVVAGVILGITALANWYYGLFAGMALIGLLIRAAWRHWHRRRHGGISLDRLMSAGATLGLGGAVCVLVVTPIFALFLLSMNAEDAVVTRDPSFVWATLVLHNMTDVLALVHPGRFYSPDLKESFGEDLIVVIYLGHALLWPALLSLWVARRAVASWAALAAGYLVLTLGPFLYINGDYAIVAGGWIPLPFLALFEWFPVFSRISHAYRFAVGATLALCVMLAWSIAHLQDRRRLPVAGVVILLITGRVLESFYGSSAVFPIPSSPLSIPPAYRTLADQTGAVLDLPVGIPVLARSQYALNQMVHQRPIPYGLNDPMPGALWENRFTRYLIELEWSSISTLPAGLPWLDLMMGREAIVAQGLEWIVLHKDHYQPPQYARMVRFLDLVATPIHDGEELRIYRVEPTREP